MEGFNINGCVDKEFHAWSFHNIAQASVSALEGIGEVGQGILKDGHTAQNTVKTVRDLGTWRYYRLARALVDLRDAEQQGKRDEHCELSLRAGIVKAWASKSLEEICAAPVSALYGLPASADQRFAKAPLHITSVEKLAESKFCKWAAAICTLAELGEDDTNVLRARRAEEAAREAQQKAEDVAVAATAALVEALQRAEFAEEAKAGAEEAIQAEHVKEEALEKAQQQASAKASIAEQALDDAMKRLRDVEAEKEAAERRRKEAQQKQREAERRAALAEQERKGRELEDRFHRLFKELDQNGDGFLSHHELKSYVASTDPAMRLKLGIGRWQDFLAEADADGDHKISEADFIAHFTRTNLDPVKCYGALFDSIDCWGNGFITIGEFNAYSWYKNPHLFRLLGVSNWEDFVASVDVDHNGVVAREEFVSHYTRIQNSGKILPFASEAGGEPSAKRART